MISFKQMWDDVLLMLSDNEYSDIEIIERFENGFAVKEQGNIIFITKADFSDVWCKLLYYNKLTLEQIIEDDKLKPKYIYNIIKQLPYVSENSGEIKLIQ
ncbi:hypothetical protein KPL37_08575 [Clostridium frigoris]|uniref:Uncharacterized protein n=1 Tax=Clostridium frigoris TaxID=205327 RepID=A0ABS6BUZ4_9CLOT|nr:hypothetical protein [Clostridium frigoris]MBU3159804.1 hypothetical protein [Clostridium frigoris]